MSKKHFRALAEAFNCNKPVPKGTNAYNIGYNAGADTFWRISVNLVADVCTESNPNFDRAKFLDACENGLNKKQSTPAE